jgi:hypothetical protein
LCPITCSCSSGRQKRAPTRLASGARTNTQTEPHGPAGSLAGAALGLAIAAEFAGQLPPRLIAAAVAAAGAGVLVSVGATLLPAQLLRRLPAAHLIAEE